MAAGARVFLPGNYPVLLQNVDSGGTSIPPPPKPILLASPTDPGEFPVLVFLHGYLLYNSFYSDLIRHISSHGFIVVAPQMYCISGPDSSEEIKAAAALVEWLPTGLPPLLPSPAKANISKLAIAGHSRGGKVYFLSLELGSAHAGIDIKFEYQVAFALLLELVKKPSLKFSAIIGIDPVDGMGKGKQTTPPVLTYIPKSMKINVAAMVIGSAFGEHKKGALPACAPAGVNHRDFAAELSPPSCYLVAGDYGHLDMLDDVTPGLRGKATYCLCKSGGARAPMRRFVGGAVVAFLRAFLLEDDGDLVALRDNVSLSPVRLTSTNFSLGEEVVNMLSHIKFC